MKRLPRLLGRLGSRRELNILHVGKFYHPYSGGIENFLRDLCAAQAAAGHTVRVLAHNHQFWSPTSRERFEGCEIVRARTLGQAVYAPVCPEFPLLLARLIRHARADLIHAHLPNPSAFSLLAVATNVPLVLHWHADVVSSEIDRRVSLLYPPYAFFERKLLRRARLVVGTSERYIQSSRPLAPFRDKCAAIPLGLDETRLTARDGLEALRTPRPLILSVGRFTYYKGFEYLIRAAAILPDVDFALIGDGPLRPSMVRLAQKLGVSDRVRLPGRLGDAELRAWLEACDIFCLPSVERTEAFGVALLEAMACAKPLITADIPGSGVGFVNQDGETGLVVPVADSDALARAIQSLLQAPARLAAMGEAAKRRFAARFRIEAVAREMDAAYTSALAR